MSIVEVLLGSREASQDALAEYEAQNWAYVYEEVEPHPESRVELNPEFVLLRLSAVFGPPNN